MERTPQKPKGLASGSRTPHPGKPFTGRGTRRFSFRCRSETLGSSWYLGVLASLVLDLEQHVQHEQTWQASLFASGGMKDIQRANPQKGVPGLSPTCVPILYPIWHVSMAFGIARRTRRPSRSARTDVSPSGHCSPRVDKEGQRLAPSPRERRPRRVTRPTREKADLI